MVPAESAVLVVREVMVEQSTTPETEPYKLLLHPFPEIKLEKEAPVVQVAREVMRKVPSPSEVRPTPVVPEALVVMVVLEEPSTTTVTRDI